MRGQAFFSARNIYRNRAFDNDLYAWGGHYAVSRPYTTNELNQYSQAGGAAFAYDANGNLVSDGTTTYSYDIENRLTAVAGARNASLAYDPLGRLWQVSAGNVTWPRAWPRAQTPPALTPPTPAP